MKDSGWSFDKNNSLTIFSYKTIEMNGSRHAKFPLRSSAILNFENDEKFCFPLSILAKVHPYESSHPNKVSNYRPHFLNYTFKDLSLLMVQM